MNICVEDGTKRSTIQRRAIGGGVAGKGKIHIGGTARRSIARRRGVGGDVAEEEGWLHRESSHGWEGRGGEGVGRRQTAGVGERPMAMVESGRTGSCLGWFRLIPYERLTTLGTFHCMGIYTRITILIINRILTII
jgi:hypothetical protein